MQELFGIEEQQGADRHTKHQVYRQSHTHHLYQSLPQSCADVLCTEDGGTHREKLIDQEYERYQLVVKSYRCHAIVAVAAQHHSIDSPQHHDEGHLDEHWDGEYLQLSFQGRF